MRVAAAISDTLQAKRLAENPQREREREREREASGFVLLASPDLVLVRLHIGPESLSVLVSRSG